MNFDDYQKFTKKTAIYPLIGKNFVYPTLGLAGEAGEIVEKVKKIFRDKEGKVSKETKEEIAKEIGDVLWYISQLSAEFGLSLNYIAEMNISKLKSRTKRKKLHGDGDNR